jgi:RNA polymerase sigma-70 factor, ECF subfamily
LNPLTDFNTIYNKHYPELYHFALRQHGASPDVSDILQDLFTKLYYEIKSGTNIENYRAWLYKVLINSLRTYYRNEKTRIVVNNKLAFKNQLSDDIYDTYIRDERLSIVSASIAKMPEKEKNILLLYHNGFSYQEISEILNINYTSVGTFIARAVEKLKTILKSQYHEMFE